jgi:hypothetical protein
MKNIHVLPTDKPSRLAKSTKSGLNAAKKGEGLYESGKFGITNFNIYITSDEEIKEGDWCLNIPKNIIYKKDGLPMDIMWKKIILTTDQDLIKDGVQSIDDEFLKWFVNNPSCEEVGIEPLMAGFVDDEPSYYENMYDIIIPKEEQTKCYCGHTSYCDCGPKQETLEEAALNYSTDMLGTIYEELEKAFAKGSKWQMERSYSEEEVINLLYIRSMCQEHYESDAEVREWFNKFKKN